MALTIPSKFEKGKNRLLWLRVPLACAFTLAGVWLAAYASQFFLPAGSDFAWYATWAWDEPIRFRISLIGAYVYFGYFAGAYGSALAMFLCDMCGVLGYLVTALLLIFNKRWGLLFATGACLVNVVCLLSPISTLVEKPGSWRWPNAVLIMAAAIGTALIGLSLLRLQAPQLRSIARSMRG